MKIRRIDFYPDDWLTGTRGMTMPECGLYWNICALMYAKNTATIERDEARKFFHCQWFDRLLDRLIAAGKFIEDGSKIHHRRVEDELKRRRRSVEDASKAASRRWEDASKVSGKAMNNKENGHADASDSAYAYNLQSSINNQQDTRASPRASVNGEAFDRWWEDYPEKVGKGAARKAFPKALAKTSLDQLIVGVERYKATKPRDRAWCNPATWLNEERWLDQPDHPTRQPSFGAPGFG